MEKNNSRSQPTYLYAGYNFPKPPHCKGELYTVQKGDTLYLIAKKYGISLEGLIKVNPQISNPDLIYPGQMICIPIKPVPETVVFSTGPLAIDAIIQRFAGVLLENNSKKTINFGARLYDKDLCPKALAFNFEGSLEPGCTFPITMDLNFIGSFFYEIQVEVPRCLPVLITVYGLTVGFGIVSANTLRHSELIQIVKDERYNTALNKRGKKEAKGHWSN